MDIAQIWKKLAVRNELHIESHPDNVWAVTVDISKLTDWSPTADRVRDLGNSKINIGSQYELEQPGQPIAVWTVTQFKPKSLFAWDKKLLGMNLSGIHQIDPLPSGTKSTLILEASGLSAFLLYPLLRRFFIRAIAQENAGLQSYCETHYPLN